MNGFVTSIQTLARTTDEWLNNLIHQTVIFQCSDNHIASFINYIIIATLLIITIKDYTTLCVQFFEMKVSLFTLFLAHKRNTKSNMWQNFDLWQQKMAKWLKKNKSNQFVKCVVKVSLLRAAILQIFFSIYVNTTHKYMPI